MGRLVTFFALVFAMCVPIWLLGWLAGVHLTPDLPLSAVVFVVPGMAALIMARRDGGAGHVNTLLRRAVDWQVVEPRGWLLVAIFVPFGITAMALVVLHVGVVMIAFHVVPLWQHGRSTTWVLWWCLSTVTLRVLQVWLYANTGSVFAVALMHAMINMALIGPFLYYGPEGLTLAAQRANAVVSAVAAAIVVVSWGRRTLAEFRWGRA